MRNVTDVTIPTGQIREAWHAIQKGENPVPRQRSLSGYVNHRWRGSTVDSFVGASGEQIDDRLTNGYWPEGESMMLSSKVAEVNMPVMEYDEEEGNLVIEDVLAGEDMYRIRWTNDEARGGLKIRANIAMNCGTEAKVIEDYMRWVLTIVDAAQAQGIAPELELFIQTTGSFEGRYSESHRINIPVVKAGELVDTVAWRAFLAGGAFRSLGFLAMGLAGDKLGLTLTGTLGAATGTDWTVEGTAEEIILGCPSGAKEFPAERMQKLLDALS